MSRNGDGGRRPERREQTGEQSGGSDNAKLRRQRQGNQEMRLTDGTQNGGARSQFQRPFSLREGNSAQRVTLDEFRNLNGRLEGEPSQFSNSDSDSDLHNRT